MVRRIESLGDRLLGRLVPRTNAVAANCWVSLCQPLNRCRVCCQVTGGVDCSVCEVC